MNIFPSGIIYLQKNNSDELFFKLYKEEDEMKNKIIFRPPKVSRKRLII